MDPATPRSEPGWTIALLASLTVVALLTLTPSGQGWAWGSPTVELRWYLDGLDSRRTMLQLVGNLLLLAVPAVLAVRWRPALGRLGRLVGLSLLVAGGIEALQWALPLGRVVSPLDALLNATGAVVAGLLTAWLAGTRPGVVRWAESGRDLPRPRPAPAGGRPGLGSAAR